MARKAFPFGEGFGVLVILSETEWSRRIRFSCRQRRRGAQHRKERILRCAQDDKAAPSQISLHEGGIFQKYL